MIYYPEKNFNGILIVLKEPGDPEGTEEGSKAWFRELIDEKKTGGKSIDRKQRRYRNRFMEMLELCGEDKLASTAYGNIKPLKGGKKLSTHIPVYIVRITKGMHKNMCIPF